MNSPLVFVLSVFCVSSLFVNEVVGDCCPKSGGRNGYGLCLDGTKGTPFCGYGPCNIFGCNCEGGCRKKLVRAVSNVSDGFVALDVNGDGKVTLEEAKANIAVDYLPRAEEEFARMDLNLDGFLTREEIDS